MGFALIFLKNNYAKIGGMLFLIFDIILIISAIKNIKNEIKIKKIIIYCNVKDFWQTILTFYDKVSVEV